MIVDLYGPTGIVTETPLQVPIPVQPQVAEHERFFKTGLTIQVASIIFKEPGEYEFRISVDGDHIGAFTFIVQLPQAG